MSAGLILDIGHVGKPAPQHRDRGALHGQRVEAVLADRYALRAAEVVTAAGGSVVRLTPPAAGWSYDERHRRANAVAVKVPATKWLYVQCHLNSAERDPRYGLVGHDPRSARGKVAAEALAEALRAAFVPGVLDRVRVEAAAGDWSRMLGTIDGIYDGPPNICGVCYEPAFIQSDSWATPDGSWRVGEALAAGFLAWAPR